MTNNMPPADLRVFMARRNWNQKETAERLGVTRQTVYNWINGHTKIPTTVARLIACLDANPERAEE